MVATGVVSEGPAHTHDQDEVTGLETDLTNRSLLVVSEPGTRWYLTSDPFAGALVAQLETGDRFTYPLGHAQARETYRWDGSSWQLEETLPVIPAAAELVVASSAQPSWQNITPATNVTHWATHNAQARIVYGLNMVELSGRLTLTGTVNSGTSWGQLPAGHSPLFEMKIGIRSAGTGATGNTLTISDAGVITFGASLNSGAELLLDSIRFRRL